MNLNGADIPDELKELNQWVLWKFEIRDGKPTKVPYTTDGPKAKPNDPSTWAPFDACANASEGFDGIGFVLSEADDYTVIDFDGCRDPETGKIDPETREWVRRFDTYTEVSQSERGLHVLGRGTLPGVRRRNGNVEMYDRLRFVIMTGQHLDMTPCTIEPRQEAINELYHAEFGDDPEPPVKTDARVPNQLKDSDVIKKASEAKNGAKFKRLFFDGDICDYGDDDSSADLALCDLIRFWSGDPRQIDDIFRRSALMRPKWDEKRGAKTYGEITLARAMRGEVYSGSQDKNGEPVGERNNNAVVTSAPEYGDPWQYWDEGDKNGKNKKFVAKKLGDAILEANRILHLQNANEPTGDLYVYDRESRLYVSGGEAIIQEEARARLGDLFGTHRIAETLNYIRWSGHKTREEVEPPVNLIPGRDGIIDIKTGMRLEYSPNVPMFVKHNGAYRPELLEDPPESVVKMLSAIPPGDIPIVQEAVGACLYRRQLYKKAFMFLGDGDNGKSLLLTWIRKMLLSVSAVSLFQITFNRFASAELYHQNANIHADLGGGDLKHTGFFMMLTGGDEVPAEYKHKTFFTFTSYATQIYSTNILPDVKNPPDQFYNRWILIEMPFCYVPNPDKDASDYVKKDDPHLEESLLTEDCLDWLFTWGIEGLIRLLDVGHFSESVSTKEIKERWISKTDSLQAFVREMVEVDYDSRIIKSEFMAAYQAWCGNADMTPQTKERVGRYLPKFITTEEIQTRPRSWLNIRIKGQTQNEEEKGKHGLFGFGAENEGQDE